MYTRDRQIEAHPEIFNPVHIAYVKKWQAITAGEQVLDSIYIDDDESQLTFVFTCPHCNHDSRIKYTSLYERRRSRQWNIKFNCYHCLTWFYADADNDIYFLTEINQAFA